MNTILNALRPVKRRLRRNRFLAGAAAGLATGAALALCLQVLSFWVPLPGKAWILAACLPACALAAGAVNAARKITPRAAAEAADRCGLQERAVTALETAGDGDMEILLREDACRKLQALDPRRIPGPRAGRQLAAALGCALLTAGLFLVPNLADRRIAEAAELRQQLARAAEQAEEAASKDEKALSEAEKSELRRLTADLKRELGESRDKADALVALDRAEQRAERLRQKTAGNALQALSDALAAAGMKAAAEAMKAGDEGALAEQLQAADADTLAEIAEGLDGDAKELAEALASAGTGGNAAQAAAAALKSLQSLSAASLSNLSKALSGANAQLGGTGTQASQSGSKDGSGGSGAGGASGKNGAAGGAGKGSTNLDAGKTGTNPGGGAKGTNPAEYREGQYETIYDSERFDRVTRDEMTNLNRQGEDSVQIETGPGRGNLQGDVPYGEVVQEYARTEAQAADRQNLTEQEKQWVRDYFTLLTDQ